MEPYQQLEQAWAEFNNLDPEGMVACSSGTAALHLAFEAASLPSGTKVLCPDLTMIACPRAITLANLEPLFVDCTSNLLMDWDLVTHEYCVNYHVRANLVVHVYGRRFQFPDWYRGSGLYVIEDLAEAHGIKPHKWTAAACWSFYKNKVVAGEEGGAVWFRDIKHASLARQLRNLGFTDNHDFTHIPRGHNYRLSNSHASLILSSLEIIGSNLRARRTIEGWYNEACPTDWQLPLRDVPWVYDFRLVGMRKGLQDHIVNELHKENIQARHCFKPMHYQQEYKDNTCITKHTGHCVSSTLSQEVLYLPIQPGVTTRDQVIHSFNIINRLTTIGM